MGKAQAYYPITPGPDLLCNVLHAPKHCNLLSRTRHARPELAAMAPAMAKPPPAPYAPWPMRTAKDKRKDPPITSAWLAGGSCKVVLWAEK